MNGALAAQSSPSHVFRQMTGSAPDYQVPSGILPVPIRVASGVMIPDLSHGSWRLSDRRATALAWQVSIFWSARRSETEL